MPKIVKKKSFNVQNIALDTGSFAYYNLASQGTANIVKIQVSDSYSSLKERDQILDVLLNQLTLITKKEGYNYLLYNTSMWSNEWDFFETKGWKSLYKEKNIYNSDYTDGLLVKDNSAIKRPTASLVTLLGDDQKEKISKYISTSSFTAKAEGLFDNELEPNIPNRPEGNLRDRLAADAELEAIAPAEPININNPIPQPRDAARWVIPDIGARRNAAVARVNPFQQGLPREPDPAARQDDARINLVWNRRNWVAAGNIAPVQAAPRIQINQPRQIPDDLF